MAPDELFSWPPTQILTSVPLMWPLDWAANAVISKRTFWVRSQLTDIWIYSHYKHRNFELQGKLVHKPSSWISLGYSIFNWTIRVNWLNLRFGLRSGYSWLGDKLIKRVRVMALLQIAFSLDNATNFCASKQAPLEIWTNTYRFILQTSV